MRFAEGGGEENLGREREVVRWVARLGAVSVGQIGSRFGVGRSVAYELVRRYAFAQEQRRVSWDLAAISPSGEPEGVPA